ITLRLFGFRGDGMRAFAYAVEERAGQFILGPRECGGEQQRRGKPERGFCIHGAMSIFEKIASATSRAISVAIRSQIHQVDCFILKTSSYVSTDLWMGQTAHVEY